MLLIDATQGIQAQTVTNVYLALEHDMDILPAVDLTTGGLRCDLTPRDSYVFKVSGSWRRAFQSCAKMPSSASKTPCVKRSVSVGPETLSTFSLPMLWSQRQSKKRG